MFQILIAALAALSLAGIATADAAAKKKKVRYVAPAITAPAYPYYARTPGPVWAMPNECFTDEGYGRYWPCGAGRSGF